MERDRLNNLILNNEKLKIQKSVVIEEFNQRYLNQPYGDALLLLRDLTYKKHPYRWATIGKSPSHIEQATMNDIKTFYNKYYTPNNLTLSVIGNYEFDCVKELADKNFGQITSDNSLTKDTFYEPPQKKQRTLYIRRDVSQKAIYLSFVMAKRTDRQYYCFDMLSDILSNGKSSRLVENLTKKNNAFTNINCCISGDMEQGMFLIMGFLSDKTAFNEAEELIFAELDKIKYNISSYELRKVKNKFASTMVFANLKPIDKAMNLAFYDYLGNIDLLNSEVGIYQSIAKEELQDVAQKTFTKEKSNILYYDK
jgi:predicted Zn-dependent peptidase